MGDKPEEKWNYEDIADLPHHVSTVHPPMDIRNRAAQFSPFAALTGYEDAIAEEARLTDGQIELSDEMFSVINENLAFLYEHAADYPEIRIHYFKPDERKAGGSYLTVRGVLKKIDPYGQRIVLQDGSAIPFRDIMEIEADH